MFNEDFGYNEKQINPQQKPSLLAQKQKVKPVLKIVLAVASLMLLGCFLFAHHAQPVSAATTNYNFYGYIWGENIGWVSLRSTSGVSYGVTMSCEGAGICVLDGYAWSENAGWLDFTSGSYQATLNQSTGQLSGWIWSENVGWISLRSTSGVSYGVNAVVGSTQSYLNGYAWGENIGWIRFDHNQSAYLPYTNWTGYVQPNNPPSAPTSLYTNSTDAQSGSTNPTGIDFTPVFSTVYSDPDGDQATQYNIQVCTNSTCASGEVYNYTGNINTPSGSRTINIGYSGSSLTYNTTYYWRIKFYDGDVWGNFSTINQFTTLAANSPPNAPTNLYVHSNNAQSGLGSPPSPTGIDTTPVFSAIYSDPNGDMASRYNIQVCNNSSCGSVKWSSAPSGPFNWPSGSRTPNISYGGSTLTYSTTYYWRIRFYDGQAWGNFSTINQFTTGAASVPEPYTYNLGSSTWYTTSPYQYLNWNYSGSQAQYYVYARSCTDSSFTNCPDLPINTGYLSGTTKSYRATLSTGYYYWMVKIRNTDGSYSDWSEKAYFQLDVHNPTITLTSVDGNAYTSGGTYGFGSSSLPITVIGSAADTGSGLKTIKWFSSGNNPSSWQDVSSQSPFTHNIPSNLEGYNQIYYRSYDNADRYSSYSYFKLYIDKAAPNTPGSLAFSSPAAGKARFGWAAVTDNGSGSGDYQFTSGLKNYKWIYSYDGYSYQSGATTTSLYSSDLSGLTPGQRVWFGVQACDNTDNCGAWAYVDGYVNRVPNSLSAIPTNNNYRSGTGQVYRFKATYSDADGWADLKDMRFLINSNIDGNNSACYARFLRTADDSNDHFYLYNSDASPADFLDLGAVGQMIDRDNPNCRLKATSYRSNQPPNNIDVYFDVEFKAGWTENTNTYIWSMDFQGQYNDWVDVGNANIIANRAPAITSLTITPNPAYTNDSLTANVATSDADGDQVTVAYQWYKNGSPISGQTSLILPHSQFVKNDVIKVRVTPSDPYISGNWQEATVTISNSPPNVPTGLVMNPPVLYANSDITASTNPGTDPDGDPVTIRYGWQRIRGGNTVSSDWVTSTGLPQELKPIMKNDTIQVMAIANDGTVDSSGTTSWVTKVVQNSAPGKASNPVLSPSPIYKTDILTATSTATDPDSADALTLTMYYLFCKNSTTCTSPWITGNTYSGGFIRGDIMNVRAKAHDGTVFGTESNWSSITISNRAPVAQNVLISPPSPRVIDNLTVGYSYSDADGDAESFAGRQIRWYKIITPPNGSLQSAFNDQLTVPSASLSHGQQWYFTIKVSDGAALSALVTSPTVTVGSANTPPSFNSAVIQSSEPNPNEAYKSSILTVITGGWYDPDGDPAGYAYQWYRGDGINQVAIPGANSATLPGGVDKGNFVTVEVTAWDGTDPGNLIESAPIEILNTPPMLTSVDLQPANPALGDTMVATPQGYSDTDNDPVSQYGYIWRKNGFLIAGATTNTLLLGGGTYNVGDVIRVEARAYDGEDWSSLVTSLSRTIVATEPVTFVSDNCNWQNTGGEDRIPLEEGTSYNCTFTFDGEAPGYDLAFQLLGAPGWANINASGANWVTLRFTPASGDGGSPASRYIFEIKVTGAGGSLNHQVITQVAGGGMPSPDGPPPPPPF